MQGVALKAANFAEPSTLERAFLDHQARVFRAAFRITGNAQDAEDVLQTVFLRLARQGEAALPVANPSSYLYRAAINAALDVLRARRDRASVPIEEAEGSAAGPAAGDRTHRAAEIRDWLRKALAGLEPRAAEIFVLRYVEDQDNRDIARMLGLSRVAVAVTLHRSRRRLQEQFRLTKRGRP